MVYLKDLEIKEEIVSLEKNYELNLKTGEILNKRFNRKVVTSVNRGGYKVFLRIVEKNGGKKVRKAEYLHRLIARVLFEQNGLEMKKGYVVMHLDETRYNNDISNLAYGSQKENMTMFPKVRERKRKRKDDRAIVLTDLEGNVIRDYDCLADLLKEGIIAKDIAGRLLSGSQARYRKYKLRYR